MEKISIIGDGGWGTALAIHLAKKGHKVCIWGAFEDYVVQTAKSRENKKFLPGYKIPPSVKLTANINEAIQFAEVIVLASPSEYLASTLVKLQSTPYKGKLFVSVVKGIDPQSFKRMSEIIYDQLGRVNLVVLSGPTIAGELAAGIATTAVSASKNANLAKRVQGIFNSPTFRIYTNRDVAGVEIGGSVKNVIALACGICDGLELGTNAKAALLTRGLAEITRLGIAMGGKRETFYGLTGLGDLITTCFSPHSRNRTVGELLGKGKTLKQALGSMHSVAEGVVTAKAVYRLSVRKKIAMPLVSEVYRIMFENKNARKAMTDLMKRSLKSE